MTPPPGHPASEERAPLGWEDLFVGAMLLAGAGSAVVFFLSPLIGALLFMSAPYNLVIVGIYSSLFCFFAYKAIQDAYADDEEADTTLKFRIEG